VKNSSCLLSQDSPHARWTRVKSTAHFCDLAFVSVEMPKAYLRADEEWRPCGLPSFSGRNLLKSSSSPSLKCVTTTHGSGSLSTQICRGSLMTTKSIMSRVDTSFEEAWKEWPQNAHARALQIVAAGPRSNRWQKIVATGSRGGWYQKIVATDTKVGWCRKIVASGPTSGRWQKIEAIGSRGGGCRKRVATGPRSSWWQKIVATEP